MSVNNIIKNGFHSKCKKIAVLIIICVICVITLNQLKRRFFRRRHFLFWRNDLYYDEEIFPVCNIRHLDPFAREVTANSDQFVPDIACDGQDWVKCYFSECTVVAEILKKVINVECTYNDIIYISDLNYTLGPDYYVKNEDKYILTKSDHVKVSCVAMSLYSVSKLKWTGYASGLRIAVKRRFVPRHRKYTSNVLIFGYESTSKNGFIRRMPKSYKYLTEVLKGTVLHGYNILDESNPSALLPMLTGFTEKELHNVRKTGRNNKTLDLLPFIFYKLRDDGYRTAFFQDLFWTDMVRYQLNGFREQPTDHYLQAFYMEERNGNWFQRLKNKYCLGDTPQSKFMMNITEQFLRLDGKKFVFTFLSDITREDFNIISTTDDDLVQMLRSLLTTGVLENTLVIIMGDNGRNFINFKTTFQGKLEQQLPFMCIVLPEALKRRRPDIQFALKANGEALTTPYDIHATILDALDMQELINHYRKPGAHTRRALSLLVPISRSRLCKDAGIVASWCACDIWRNVSKHDNMYKRATTDLIDFINFLTEKLRAYCRSRYLVEVIWIMKQEVPINPKKPHRSISYHVKAIIGPGYYLFEAFMKYEVFDDKFLVDSNDIILVDSTIKTPACLVDRLGHLDYLKSYCYCTDDYTYVMV